MKIFVVLYEEPGLTIKAPGISEQAIKRVERRIAAMDLETVYQHIKQIREDPERHFIGVWEEHPMVEILAAPDEAGG